MKNNRVMGDNMVWKTRTSLMTGWHHQRFPMNAVMSYSMASLVLA